MINCFQTLLSSATRATAQRAFADAWRTLECAGIESAAVAAAEEEMAVAAVAAAAAVGNGLGGGGGGGNDGGGGGGGGAGLGVNSSLLLSAVLRETWAYLEV